MGRKQTRQRRTRPEVAVGQGSAPQTSTAERADLLSSDPTDVRADAPARPIATLFVSLLLLAGTAAIFAQTLGFEFTNLDDNEYVYKNSHVTSGLKWENVRWAFTEAHAANWHPLTWISHMADCQMFHLNAGGHHFINVLWHTLTAVLLFLTLQRMTGRLWPSAWVAAVFAIHPLHVESVAWVAERKDVLSGFWFVATLAAYDRYARRTSSWLRYAGVVLCFVLGLLSKSMLVTTPFVLLLLDYWPLRRWTKPSRPPVRLILEKIPLFVLSAVSCWMTIWAQSQVEAFKPIDMIYRVANGVLSYGAYLYQMVVPMNMAPHYTHAGVRTINEKGFYIAVAGTVLITITVVAIRNIRARAYWIVGWLWYLGMLVPVIGLSQVGTQARADRYTYLPQIGIYLAIAWGVADFSRAWRMRSIVLGAAVAASLALLSACAWLQASYWHDNLSLWAHATQCFPSDDFSHNSLGVALGEAGKPDDAQKEYRKAVELNPGYAGGQYNLAGSLFTQGKTNEAHEHASAAVQIEPNNPRYLDTLGAVDYALGKTDDAIKNFNEAVRIQPDDAIAQSHLGHVLYDHHEFNEAIPHLRRAIDFAPDMEEPRRLLALCDWENKDADGAASEFEQLIRLNPGDADSRENLIRIYLSRGQLKMALPHMLAAIDRRPDPKLATFLSMQLAASSDDSFRNGAEALRIAQKACDMIDYQSLRTTEATDVAERSLEALAAANAELGRFDEAVAAIDRALALKGPESEARVASLRQLRALFESHRPLRLPPVRPH